MKEVLIVSSRTSQLCRSIVQFLRPIVRDRALVGCHFGDKFAELWDSGIDWDNTRFVVLALSSYSQTPESKQFEREARVLEAAARRTIPIGIVHDGFGTITAPHITGIVHEAVTLVIAETRNDGCSPEQHYSNVKKALFVDELGPESIAKEVSDLFPQHHVIGEPTHAHGGRKRFTAPKMGETIDLDRIPFSEGGGSSW